MLAALGGNVKMVFLMRFEPKAINEP